MTGASAVADVTTVSRPALPTLTRSLDLALRHRRVIIAGWMAYCCYAALAPFNDWIWFAWGSDLLFGHHHVLPAFHLSARAAGGLHVYANYFFLQMGPLSLLPAQVLRNLGPDDGVFAATAFIGLLGFFCWIALDQFTQQPAALEPVLRRTRLTSLIVGLALGPCWGQLAGGYSHLDDAMALTFAVLAWGAVRRDRSVLAGALLGAAVGSKMWAIPFLALCLVPTGARRKVTSLAAGVGVAAACWAPFYLADPNTRRLADLGLTVSYGSALHVFGIDHISHPATLRLLQFVIGLGLSCLLVRLGRPGGVVLVALASRLALEPMTFTYYAGSFLLAAAMFDLLAWRRPKPVMTGVALIYMLALSNYVTAPYDRAWLRAISTMGCVLVAVVAAAIGHRTAAQPLSPAPTIAAGQPA